jgi:hypothetical protein
MGAFPSSPLAPPPTKHTPTFHNTKHYEIALWWIAPLKRIFPSAFEGHLISMNIFLRDLLQAYRSLAFLNCRCKIHPRPTIPCDLSILSLLIRFILCFIWGMGKDCGLSITSIILQISKNCYRAPLQKEGKGCCTSKCYRPILLRSSNFVSILSFCPQRGLVHCASTSNGHWRILWAL